MSHFPTNRALVYTIEAARVLCGGSFFYGRAAALLKLAIDELDKARAEQKRRGT